MSESVEKIIGPRVPAEEMKVHRGRYLAPTVLFLLAALLLIVSVFLPYWQLTLHAPQYPKGLTVEAYVNRLTGDVHEIDGLNHYIGMRPLDEAAPFEKSVAVLGVVVVALLVLAAVFVHSRWAALLALPALF
ncbi:MAG: cytochrome C, partial [Anaerolineae bacterium]|nr:cytochrome C [Anaerolineae bacterium]